MDSIPYLYVEGFGPSQPVLLSGARSWQFVWDAQRRCHVHRFASLAEFNAEAKEIIQHESVWKIFPGMDEEAKAEVDGATAEGEVAELLSLCLAACQAIAEGEDPGPLFDPVAHHPAVQAVRARLAKAPPQLPATPPAKRSHHAKTTAKTTAKPTGPPPAKRSHHARPR